jgi:hypothetical protein
MPFLQHTYYLKYDVPCGQIQNGPDEHEWQNSMTKVALLI